MEKRELHREIVGGLRTKKPKFTFKKQNQKLLLSVELPVKPWGNFLWDQLGECRQSGLGRYLKQFPDEWIQDFVFNHVLFSDIHHKDQSFQLLGRSLEVLKEFKDRIRVVLELAKCSKTLFTLLSHDAFWREIMIKCFGGSWNRFMRSWKETFIARFAAEVSLHSKTIKAKQYPLLVTPTRLNPFKIKNFYSDFLFASLQCANIPIESLCRVSKDENGEWDISGDGVPRISNPSESDFKTLFSAPNTPCIVTDLVPQWEAFKSWETTSLCARFGKQIFRAEAVDIELNQYLHYLERCEGLHGGKIGEESPLYLFDKEFASTCPELASEYQIPKYFSQDLFSVLTETINERPDYRWIIIGPSRSGSTFHVDPNATSAWNAVITGAKKWILFPPSLTPPGVFVNNDMSEVTSPQSLTEWYLHYYDQVEDMIKDDSIKEKPVIGICRAGEIMFVPTGWWHCVINLSESIAITQNYVDDYNIDKVLRFLNEKRDQVSGFNRGPELYELFVDALKHKRPLLYEKKIKKMTDDALQSKMDQGDVQDIFPSPSFWNSLSSVNRESNSKRPLFSFQFQPDS